MNKTGKALLIGCGCLVALSVAGVVGGVVWLLSRPESGVKLTNEMQPYALEYLSEHGLLEPGEEVLAYYDVTVAMDGTEAAILTDGRVLYHSEGRTTSIRLAEIEDVRHRYESLSGDVIEIEAASGEFMKIEIAPLNSGETFKNVLLTAWRRARESREGG
jgi:hypothetical protein